MIIVAMGVSGSGKTTIDTMLADAIRCRFGEFRGIYSAPVLVELVRARRPQAERLGGKVEISRRVKGGVKVDQWGGGVSARRQVGGEKPIKPVSGTAQRASGQSDIGQSEVDTSGRQGYGFAQG
jgi:hypothetical protein